MKRGVKIGIICGVIAVLLIVTAVVIYFMFLESEICFSPVKDAIS